MSHVWIVGRKATIATNGHDYITEPFIAFKTAGEAEAAAAMVKRVSGETAMIVEVPVMRDGRADLEPTP